ncbi:MAG: hypothetical protein E6G81_07825 [Alphaproteobacteria bacterium]|nr:MAG: hypothetical protein E6G81_07825 [Alphaproteobacteria bacterium]
MGAWGTGLYSGDFAMDLRGTIRAVARLPFPADRLVDVLCDTEAGAAHNPNDPDHTVFWLVLADQFWKRGIECPRARDAALSIIDEGRDRDAMAALGMPAPDLRRRERVLAELRSRLASAPAPKPRTTLKKPQAYLMEVGDCYAYPTSGGKNINPYFAAPEKIPDWHHDGWAVMIVVACGRAFDYLAWYRFLTIDTAIGEKPAAIPMDSSQLWVLRRPGTVTPLHIKRLRLEKLGAVAIDGDKFGAIFPGLKPGIAQAINDISIANQMNVGPHLAARWMPRPGEPREARTAYPTILGLRSILAGTDGST